MAAIGKIERAHQMYRDGQHLEALGFYTDALSMAKTKAQRIALHSNRAACYLKLHDFKKAAEECTSVLELDHQHTGALMLRAQTLVTLKEYQSALFDVNRLMELNPSSDVYRNLQARLRTQLSLAPIPESEEESLILEEEQEQEQKQKQGEKQEEKEDGGDHGGEEKIISANVEKVECPRNSTHTRVLQQWNADEVGVKLEASRDKTNSTDCQTQNAEKDAIKKVEVGKTQDPALAMQHFKTSSAVHPKGWEAIPKPKGHSGLDYSRWDQVEDDSSEDDEEEQQPWYRFRVQTVGVRPVK